MSRDAAGQCREWLDCIGRVPVCLLEIELTAVDAIRINRFPGSKINGALWGDEPPQVAEATGLARVAAGDPAPEIRALARLARTKHERGSTPAGYDEKPLVLGLPWDPLVLRPGEGTAINAVLFGDTIMTWPAWVKAAEHLHLQPGRMRCSAYRLWTAEGPLHDPPLDSGVTPPLSLAELIPPDWPLDQPVAWQICFETPLVLSTGKERKPALASLEPLLVSALSSLGAIWSSPVYVPECGWVTPRRPGREATDYLRELAAGISPLGGKLRHVQALYRESKATGTQTRIGVLGELSFASLPPLLAEILSLAQFTHIGQHSAFGLGRFLLRSLRHSQNGA